MQKIFSEFRNPNDLFFTVGRSESILRPVLRLIRSVCAGRACFSVTIGLVRRSRCSRPIHWMENYARGASSYRTQSWESIER